MAQYIDNHFVTDEIDVDTSGGDVILGADYTYGFRVTGAGDVEFVYSKQYTPEKASITRAFTAGQEFFGRVSAIKQAGTTATGITAFSILP